MNTEPEFTCKYCGARSEFDPVDQTPPPDYCHPEDHRSICLMDTEAYHYALALGYTESEATRLAEIAWDEQRNAEVSRECSESA